MRSIESCVKVATISFCAINLQQTAGFIAQIFSTIVSIPMVTIATKAPGIHSFLEVDWLHFIEAVMLWSSIHVQCMSFRQAVLSVEKGKPLPASFQSILLHL